MPNCSEDDRSHYDIIIEVTELLNSSFVALKTLAFLVFILQDIIIIKFYFHKVYRNNEDWNDCQTHA